MGKFWPSSNPATVEDLCKMIRTFKNDLVMIDHEILDSHASDIKSADDLIKNGLLIMQREYKNIIIKRDFRDTTLFRKEIAKFADLIQVISAARAHFKKMQRNNFREEYSSFSVYKELIGSSLKEIIEIDGVKKEYEDYAEKFRTTFQITVRPKKKAHVSQ